MQHDGFLHREELERKLLLHWSDTLEVQLEYFEKKVKT